MDDLAKLGTVIAVSNEIHKDMLNTLAKNQERLEERLERQQKRQVWMIWASLGIVGMAVVVVGIAAWMTFHSLDKLSTQVERNSYRVEQNAEALKYEIEKAHGERMPD